MHFFARRYVQITLIAYLFWQPWLGQAAEADSCPVQTNESQASKLETPPSSCNAGNWEEVADYVGKQVTMLRMAVNRADYSLLAEYGKKVETAVNSCPSELINRVCNVECAAQRASVILFEISDLASLSEKPGTVITPNPTVKADDGVRIIDQALSYLIRGNRGSYEEAKEHSPSFNQFLRDQGRLQAIKARLLIAQGDAYYKNLSRTRATTIRNRIRNVLAEFPSDPKVNVGQETDLAMGYYETASWAIQESLIDLPQISGDVTNPGQKPGDETVDFGSLRQELESLKIDVEQRQSSINSGFLFLNIDPETFTTLSTDVLQNMLQNQLQELQDLERKIRELVLTWADKKESQENRVQVDAQNIRDERTLEVTGLQIASYEEYATSIERKFNQLLADNSYETAKKQNGIEVLEEQRLMSGLSFELKKLKQEAEGQIRAINNQNAQDLTILSRERHQEKRDNLKWLIDATLTTMNLDLQINEYKAQVADFAAQMSIKLTEIDGIEATIQSKKSQQTAEESRQKDFLQLIEKTKTQMTDVYNAHQIPLNYQICALAQEYLNYIGERPDVEGINCQLVQPKIDEKKNWADIIALRKQLFGDSGTLQASYQKVRACMGGNQCEGVQGDTLKKLINDTYTKQKAIVDTTLKNQIDDAKTKIQNAITTIRDTQREVTLAQGAFVTLNTTLGAAYLALAGAGMVGIVPDIDAGEYARAAYELGYNFTKTGIDLYASYQDYTMRRQEYDVQMAGLEREFQQANAALDVDKITRDRALVELAGKVVEFDHQNAVMHADASVAILEAEGAESRIKAEGPKILAQIKDLIAQKEALKADNGLVVHELNSAKIGIEISKAEWESLAFEIKSLESNKTGVERDRNRLLALQKNAGAQMALVEGTKTKINSLNTGVNAETSIVNDLYEQQKAGISALSKDQIDLIKSGLSIDQSRIQDAMDNITAKLAAEADLYDLNEQGRQLNAGLTAELGKIQNQLKIKRCEMINFASKRTNPTDTQTRLFLASEDVIASLTQGIPEYIRAKKNRLDYVNYIYNLYRSKVNLLSQISGPLVDTNYNYIQNSTDLLNAMKDVCTQSSGTTQGPWICKLNSNMFDQNKLSIPVAAAQFTIPSESGFMSRLLRKGSVRFEITPDAAIGSSGPSLKDTDLAAKGYFQLWQDGFSNQFNMSLVNIALRVDLKQSGIGAGGSNECLNKVFLLVRHLGYGARYFPLSSGADTGMYPVLAVTPLRQTPVRVWDLNDEGYANDYANLVNTYDSESFPEGQSSGNTNTTQAFKFLGAPLVGTYEISFNRGNDPFAAKCLAGKALNIGLAYTTPFKPLNN